MPLQTPEREALPNEPMITGKLTNAGTMMVGHEADRTGYFIEAAPSSIRSVAVLPMYEQVAVLTLAEAVKLLQAVTDREAAMRRLLRDITNKQAGDVRMACIHRE